MKIINKSFCNQLHKLKVDTPENFYKLLMFAVCMASDGTGYNKCSADELVFLDVLDDVNLDYKKLCDLAADFSARYGEDK